MRYRLLDLLACPYDRHFPLELAAETVIASPAAAASVRAKCERWCALRHCAPAGADVSWPCDGCLESDIVDGTLRCSSCTRVFPIRAGIPRLLPDQLAHAGDDPPRDHDTRIKWQQQRQRDREAESFERLFLPYQTRLDATTCLDALDLGADDRLLDGGSGVGRLLRFAAGRCAEIVALDFSARSLQVLVSRSDIDPATPVHAILGDVEHLPLRDGVFDKVLSFGILEHLPSEASNRATLREMHRVLRDRGLVALTAYNYAPLRRAMAPFSGAPHDRNGWHDEIFFHRFATAELRALLAGVFSAFTITGLRHFPKQPASLLAPIAEPLDRALARTPFSRLAGYYLLARLAKARGASVGMVASGRSVHS
jgi:uncharacterized protein YbaR (Trm112 family)/cyclopropane fatty-acyl-phospholipid synthase-like methyltransferase